MTTNENRDEFIIERAKEIFDQYNGKYGLKYKGLKTSNPENIPNNIHLVADLDGYSILNKDFCQSYKQTFADVEFVQNLLAKLKDNNTESYCKMTEGEKYEETLAMMIAFSQMFTYVPMSIEIESGVKLKRTCKDIIDFKSLTTILDNFETFDNKDKLYKEYFLHKYARLKNEYVLSTNSIGTLANGDWAMFGIDFNSNKSSFNDIKDYGLYDIIDIVFHCYNFKFTKSIIDAIRNKTNLTFRFSIKEVNNDEIKVFDIDIIKDHKQVITDYSETLNSIGKSLSELLPFEKLTDSADKKINSEFLESFFNFVKCLLSENQIKTLDDIEEFAESIQYNNLLESVSNSMVNDVLNSVLDIEKCSISIITETGIDECDEIKLFRSFIDNTIGNHISLTIFTKVNSMFKSVAEFIHKQHIKEMETSNCGFVNKNKFNNYDSLLDQIQDDDKNNDNINIPSGLIN